jgi:hypothetical protein
MAESLVIGFNGILLIPGQIFGEPKSRISRCAPLYSKSKKSSVTTAAAWWISSVRSWGILGHALGLQFALL